MEDGNAALALQDNNSIDTAVEEAEKSTSGLQILEEAKEAVEPQYIISKPLDESDYRGINTLYDGRIEGRQDTVSRRLSRKIKNAYDDVMKLASEDNKHPSAYNSHDKYRARLTHLMANLCATRGYISPKIMGETDNGLCPIVKNIAKRCHKMGYIRHDIQPGYMK